MWGKNEESDINKYPDYITALRYCSSRNSSSRAATVAEVETEQVFVGAAAQLQILVTATATTAAVTSATNAAAVALLLLHLIFTTANSTDQHNIGKEDPGDVKAQQESWRLRHEALLHHVAQPVSHSHLKARS